MPSRWMIVWAEVMTVSLSAAAAAIASYHLASMRSALTRCYRDLAALPGDELPLCVYAVRLITG